MRGEPFGLRQDSSALTPRTVSRSPCAHCERAHTLGVSRFTGRARRHGGRAFTPSSPKLDHPVQLRLQETRTFQSGALYLRYQRV